MGRLVLGDGWNRLGCGALVLFRHSIPVCVDWDKEVPDIVDESPFREEMRCFGFVDYTLDPWLKRKKHLYSIMTWDSAIMRELSRIGVANLRSRGKATFVASDDSILLDTHENGYDIILFDNWQKVEISPLRALRILRTMTPVSSLDDFWEMFSNFREESWIERFRRIRSKEARTAFQDPVTRIRDTVDPKHADSVLTVYETLSKRDKQLFESFCNNNPHSMVFVSSAMLGPVHYMSIDDRKDHRHEEFLDSEG